MNGLAELDRRDFSNETPIDSVDTKKLRVVVHRLEDDWWLLIVRSRFLGRFSSFG